MRFFENAMSQLINVDQISEVYFELEGLNDNLYSKVRLKNGVELDFLDVPSSFSLDGETSIDFGTDELITWHEEALKMIIGSDVYILSYDDLADTSFDSFMLRYEMFHIKMRKLQFDMTNLGNQL
jgi:hypothetical protein